MPSSSLPQKRNLLFILLAYLLLWDYWMDLSLSLHSISGGHTVAAFYCQVSSFGRYYMRAKSDENWKVAERCLAAGEYNAAANRFYYAVFQAVLTWAENKTGYVYSGSGEHKAMADFVKTQKHFGEVFNEMMGLRITADYDRETPDPAEIRVLLEDSSKIREHYFRKA